MEFEAEKMNSIVIDTNPLAYIYNGVPELGEKFAALLGNLDLENILTIPKIVYGELSLIFPDVSELDTFLSDTGIVIGDISPKAYVDAARRRQIYNKRRKLICHQCGSRLGNIFCKKCNTQIKIRQHILSDFIIGAYALETDETIVTNDTGYFSTYFPELRIITV